jgi:hypothetical protein
MPVPIVVSVQARLLLSRFILLPRWTVALTGAQLDPHVAEVHRMDNGGSYFVVTLKQGARTTARFALNGTGELLEAEGIDQLDTELEAYADPPPGNELAWKPCQQSLSRLEPFWRRPGSTTGPFLRVDGEPFDVLTDAGRG